MQNESRSSRSKRKKKSRVRINYRERWLVAVQQLYLSGKCKPYIDQRPLDEQILKPRLSAECQWATTVLECEIQAAAQGFSLPKYEFGIFKTGDRIQKFITPEEVAARSVKRERR
jgi:hypothetical protein